MQRHVHYSCCEGSGIGKEFTGVSREYVEKSKEAQQKLRDTEVFTRDWAPAEEPGFEFGRGKRKQRRSEKVEVDESCNKMKSKILEPMKKYLKTRLG